MLFTLKLERPTPDLVLGALEVSAPSTTRTAPGSRRVLGLCPALLFGLSAVLAQAQKYTSIVVFGDSLSDVGNVAHLTQLKYGVRIPGPVADYTDGRFTDGHDTLPAAHNYTGVWVEQLAAMLPAKPVIKDSLDGGTDYAYGSAKTGGGKGDFTFGPGDALSVNVDNVGRQITTYLATSPKINNKTLFVVWGGAIDVLRATSTDDVVRAAIDETIDVQRLISAGATQILILNLPPLGAIPRLNKSPVSSIPATKAAELFNGTLAAGIDILQAFNPGRRLKLLELDVFGLFNRVIATPLTYSLVDVRHSSQGIPGVNPDTFLFWDDLHPTTRAHELLAEAADRLINPSACLPGMQGCANVELLASTVGAGTTSGR